jgi:hypothetical protein
MKIRYLAVIGVFILTIFGGHGRHFTTATKPQLLKERKARTKSDNALQGQVIATQAFNINRFNKTAARRAGKRNCGPGTAKQR